MQNNEILDNFYGAKISIIFTGNVIHPKLRGYCARFQYTRLKYGVLLIVNSNNVFSKHLKQLFYLDVKCSVGYKSIFDKIPVWTPFATN